jgi:hypothetical protein
MTPPVTPPPLADVPVRTAGDLVRRWELLLEPPAFAARSLWLTFYDDGLMTSVVIPVDDVPAVPDRPLLANVAQVCEAIVESHVAGTAHVALALCRPGRPTVTRDDEAWERGLAEAFATTDRAWSLHLAAGGEIVPMVDLPG